MSENNHSPVIMTYGATGSGKSTDCGYSFPNALFLAVPNALRSIKSICGYEPASVDVRTIEDATNLIKQAKSKGFDSIVVDDFSYLAENTFAGLDRIRDTRQRWGKVRDVVIDFRDVARYAGMTIVLNCWEKAPSTKSDGTFVRGGAMLSGKLPEQLAGLFDMVLRCGREPQRKPWAGVYHCQHSSQYIMKDRYGVACNVNPCPMNLAEILREAKRRDQDLAFEVSRLKGLEWQEEVVENFTLELMASDPKDFTTTVETFFGRLLSEGIDPKYARWTIRDVLDRTVIRNALNQRERTFFS